MTASFTIRVWMAILVFVCISSGRTATGNHDTANGCGVFSRPGSSCTNPMPGSTCKCECADNYTGAADCADSSYLTPGQCVDHCSTDIRSGYCSNHGISSCYAKKYYNWIGIAGFFNLSYGCMDESIQPGLLEHYDTDPGTFAANGGVNYLCRCDPGYTTLGASGLCELTIRDVHCNGHGRDASGLEAGTGSCTQFPYFHESCGFGWSSRVEFGGTSGGDYVAYQCSCDPGYWGAFPNKCAATIRARHCSNHGVDSCTDCRRLSNASDSEITCQCDAESGYATLTTNKTAQCAHFVSCLNYTCGDHGNCTTTGTGCSANIYNPNGRCCSCETGYGGASCCPLRFGSTTLTCNGVGTCLSPGNCSCPSGTYLPGCCIGCDLTAQTCLADGRCTCPFVNGTKCGTKGSSCNEIAQVCICASFEFQSPTSNVTVETGGIFCCPRDTLNGLVCGGRGVCTSTPAAELPGTGGCSCMSGYAGAYCCPIAPGQTKACGANGRCMPDGTCLCDSGVTGELGACEINSKCQDDPGHLDLECNGAGLCNPAPMTNSPYGLGSYLGLLGFSDQPNIAYQTHDNTGNFTDEALILFIQRYWQAFVNVNLRTADNEGSYYPVNISACATGTPFGRGECLWNMITKCHSQRQGYLQSFSSASSYVTSQVFPYLHAGRPINSAPFFSQVASALSDACTNSTSLAREAVASLLLYEVWRMQTPQPLGGGAVALASIQMLPTNIRGYPYRCTCTPPLDTDIIGFSLARGGKYCQLLCPVGGTAGRLPLQVCSGFENGIMRGYCTDEYDDPAGTGDFDMPGIPAPGKCICGPRFAGNACQLNRAPGCFPLDSNSAEACTAARQGTCIQTLDQLSNPVFSCQCNSQFTGPYCQFNKCLPPGVITNTTVECSGRGVCQGASQCDCSSYNNGVAQTGSGNIVPFLAGGYGCELNVTFGCGTFRASALGGGVWTLCSEAGTCIPNYNAVPATASCICDTGRGGSKCDLTDCNPACNGHQNCANSTGVCSCKPFWSTPAGCAAGNRTCECSVSLCKQGTPNEPAATSCTCNAGWKTVPFGNTGVTGGIAGSCDIVQCPLVVHNDQGIRLCNEPTDSRCQDLSSILQSLATGCCVDSCPQCILSGNGTVRTCNCGAGAANPNCYTAGAGACFPVCHGNDEGHPNPPNCVNPDVTPILCNCNHVTLAANQFRDARCQRYTCANGQRVSTVCIPQQQSCCNCAGTTFTGSFCETANCGGKGVPSQDATFCVCFPPYFRGEGRNDCNLDACSPGTVVGVSPSFTCSCPSNYLIGPSSLSCVALDCANVHAVQCAACKNGGQAQVVAHAITCSCTGTNYTGSACTIPICRNGGTLSGSVCVCPLPWTGTFCLEHLCQHGGSPFEDSTACSCINGYTGNVCQTPPNSGSSSSGSASSSSSSSTGGSTNSSTAIGVEAEEEFLPDTGFIVGAAVSAALFLGVIYYYKYVVPRRDREAAMLPRRFMNMGPRPPGQDEAMPSVVYRGPSYRMAGRVKQDSDDIELTPLPDD